MRLLLGDCLDKLKELDDNSVDSIVTDPPYGLSAAKNSGKSSKGGFMGKEWDYDVPSQEIWEECLRVLKPGGHLLAFAGSRTYHRMAVRIEDAGFEIRDQIMWIYGSGFPKSMNIGKGVDKKLGNEREVVGEGGTMPIQSGGKRNTEDSSKVEKFERKTQTITKGNSEWEGWGTALKPAHEPIVMARKPLSEKTIVDNVLEWGTGGINIDESRVGVDKLTYKGMSPKKPEGAETFRDDNWVPKDIGTKTVEGRFPANIIFDEEAGKILDEQSGTSKSTGGRSGNKEGIWDGRYNGEVRDENPGFGDVGGASRFFYCPKTSKTDRNEGLDEFPFGEPPKSGRSKPASGRQSALGQPRKNHHPTVKPTDLMLYLIRLITPKGGTTLDPFMGSGSTGKGAVRGGFDFIGIEREKEYFEIAEARIQYEQDNPYNEETGERVKINKQSNKFFSF